MEELLKLVQLNNFSAIEIICFLLIFGGIREMKKLAESINQLASKIKALGDNLHTVNKDVEILEKRIDGIDSRMNRIEFELQNDMQAVKLSLDNLIEEVKKNAKN